MISFFVMNWPIGLRSLTNGALSILLQPLDNAFFMINMLAFQLNYPLILLKLAVAYRAKVLLPTSSVGFVLYFGQIFKLVFCQPLLSFS
jgi:hypothetical protein